jgi:hypothetical protein
MTASTINNRGWVPVAGVNLVPRSEHVGDLSAPDPAVEGTLLNGEPEW